MELTSLQDSSAQINAIISAYQKVNCPVRIPLALYIPGIGLASRDRGAYRRFHRPMSLQRIFSPNLVRTALVFLAFAATSAQTDPLATPKIACTALRGATGYEFSIISATPIPRSAETPAYCHVVGQILPEVRCQVNLPEQWNRRLYMTGNGGFAGEPLEAPGRIRSRERAMRRGFVETSSNTGHDAATEPLATFAPDRQKLLDYAFRSLHVTAEAAKRLARTYYGEGPQRSYYEGCSTGGRQGLILAQRFPGDFDGIIAGAPVLNFTGTMTSYAWVAQALAAAPIPLAKMKTVADRVYARCDAIDGVKDGLIDDPRRCDFQPSRDLPKCDGVDSTDCLTAGQIQALERIYADVQAAGKRLFPGWPVGIEAAPPGGRSGWDRWLLRDDGPTISFLFSDSFFRHMAFTPRSPDFDILKFDFGKDPDRLAEIHTILDATDPISLASGSVEAEC